MRAVLQNEPGWSGGTYRRGEEGVDFGHAFSFFALVVAQDLAGQVFVDEGPVAEAEVGDVGAGREGFVAQLALGLEFTEFGGAFVEETLAECAGAIDGELEFDLSFVAHGVWDEFGVGAVGDEGLFDFAAAAETPHGAADFVDEVVFEEADGGQFGAKLFGEVVVVGFFVGTDEVSGGVEAVSDSVLRGDGFTGFRTRAAPVGFFRRGQGGCCRLR